LLVAVVAEVETQAVVVVVLTAVQVVAPEEC
jgi:hypothetical protein